MLLFLSSCVFDHESCPAEEGSGAYTLSIRIGAQSLATRAVDHEEGLASEAEDFINVDGRDYCVYLLDGDGRVKQRFVPTAMTLAPGADRVYDLRGNFIPEMERMQVMVLANWGSFGGEYGYDLIGRSLEELYAADSEGKLIFGYTAADGKSWMPNKDAGKGIPMFGLSEVFEVEKEIKNNRYEVTVQKDVKMLRSLSKVEVTNQAVDGTTGVDADGHRIEIVSCRLTGYNTTGRFIPDLRGDNAEWDKAQSDGTGTRQVVSPSMPAGGNAFSASALLFGGNEGDASFTAYVPEMDFTRGGSRPQIEVILSIDGEQHDPYFIELAEYKDGVADSGYEALLRNHHYQFNITKVEVGVSTELIIHIETKAWDLDDDELTYNDLEVVFAEGKTFHWTEGISYDPAEDAAIDSDRRRLVVSRVDGVEGLFAIIKPERGTWTLKLIGDDNTPHDAFYIELWGKYTVTQADGTTTEEYGWLIDEGAASVTGNIPTGDDGIKFRIVATGDIVGSLDYTARLTMTVQTFDGRIMEVNMPYFNNNYQTVGNSSSTAATGSPMPFPSVDTTPSGYYTIVQRNSGFNDI